jgi:HSP20 family protein
MKTISKRPYQSIRPTWTNPWNRFLGNNMLNIFNDNEDSLTVPSVNIRDEKDNYRIELAAPGMKKDDFDISIDGDIMNISSEMKSENETNEQDNYYCREYNYSSFSRSLSLPENADIQNITASYDNGILNVSVPKKPGLSSSEKRKIDIQ